MNTFDQEMTKIVGEEFYISPERCKELIEALGIDLTIPESEIQFLRDRMPKQVTSSMWKQIEKLTRVSEDDSPPIVINIPRKFAYKTPYFDDQRKPQDLISPLTMASLQKMFADAKAKEKLIKSIRYNASYVPEKLWTAEVSKGTLRAFLSTCLKNSKNKTFAEQKAYRQETLGPEEIYKIEAPEAPLAMWLHYLHINCNASLSRQDWCRLDMLGNGSDPLGMPFDRGALGLFCSNTRAAESAGFSASLEFPF